MTRWKLTFYGDDFTGSTDTMEVLEWAGVPTMLFLQPPDPDVVSERFPDVQAVGVAGVSRSWSPSQMDEELPKTFNALQRFDAPFFHYKVCSTFDSSPEVGSIGRACDIGWRIFEPAFIPLIIGAPFLRRYVAFSNLFARVDETTYRLDRHPTMRQHPITPMTESDLRLHLGLQTDKKIDAVNLLQLERSFTDAMDYLLRVQADGAEIIVFDTLNHEHLQRIGQMLVTEQEAQQKPLLIVGSSGADFALGAYWQTRGDIQEPPPRPAQNPVDQIMVMSGSAAPATCDQIMWAEQDERFEVIRLDVNALIHPETSDLARELSRKKALNVLSSGKSCVFYSAKGPDDPHIQAAKDTLTRLGMDPKKVGQILGTQQGKLLSEIINASDLSRVIVTGGDTCGYVSHQLGIFALSAVMPVAPGAPLCRAYSDQGRFDGMEISLKAGQVGKNNYFESILLGGA